MSLKDQAQQLLERFEVLRERERRQADARALDHRRKEWSEMWSGLRRPVEQLDWMELKQVGLAEHGKQVALARSLIIRADTALAGGADNDGLTAEGAWAKLQKAVNKTAEVLGDSVRTGWVQLARDAGEFRAPLEIDATLPPSRPGNREAATAYRELFAQYERLRRQLAPASADDVVRLRALADQLRQVVQRFNFDQVPEAVRAFFAAVDSGQGAPLSLLTAGVREWLDKEDQTMKFVVKSL